MKKTVGLILTVAFLGGIYTGAAWFMGKKIEKVIGQQYILVEALPHAKIVKRDYQRGLFHSEETVTFEFFGEMLQALARAQAANGQPVTVPDHFKVTVHTRIQNGPLAGFSRLAAATGESELILPDSAKEKLAEVFGDNQPISCQTVFHFDGGFTSTIKGRRGSVNLPPDPDGTAASFLWDGFAVQVDSSPGMGQYTMHGRMPKLVIKDSSDTEVHLSDLRFHADQKRIFQDEPFLYSGSQLFSIDEIRVSKANGTQPPVIMKQLEYRLDIPFSDNYLDVAAKMGIKEVQAAHQKIGPTHFDFTFKHLHARTVADMYHSMLQMYANPAAFTGKPATARARMLGPLLDHLKALLEHQPEFIIDRISFAGPEGETRLAAKVRLNKATADELHDTGVLLTKLEAAGDAAIPEAMLVGMVGARQQAGADPSPKAAQTEQIRKQIAQLREQGYITNENQLIRMHAEFKQGKLRLNGRLFPPAAPGAGPTRQPNM